MEDKTRKLLLALELVAILTAAILILVDYKLKRDLVELTKNVEGAIEQARQLYSQESPSADTADNPGGLHSSHLVDNAAGMEAPIHLDETSQNGNAKTVQRARTTPKRNGGTRNTTVPRPDNAVGP